MDEKLCTKCTQILPLDNFHRAKHTKSGRVAYCKKCMRAYKIKYIAKNKDNLREKHKQYVQLNKEAIRKHSREWKSKNRNTFDGAANTILRAAKARAKIKKLDFNLDKDWVIKHLTKLKCGATGISLILEIDNRYSQSPFRPSIDRADNTKGYTKDNCQITSVIYNRTKSEYTHDDVLLMCKYLIEKNIG